MLDVHKEGKAVVSSGTARRWSATSRPCTATGCGRRCRRAETHDGRLPCPPGRRFGDVRGATRSGPARPASPSSSSWSRSETPIVDQSRRTTRSPLWWGIGPRPSRRTTRRWPGCSRAPTPTTESASAEFRRFTEPGLRDGQGRTPSVARALGDPGRRRDKVTVSLDADEAQAWLRALNDMRLVLGGAARRHRGRRRAEPGALPDDDPRLPVYGVYDWLAYLQESLVQAVW